MSRVILVVPSVHQNLEGWIAGLQGLGAEVRVEAVRLSVKKSGAMTDVLGVEVRRLPESRWSGLLRRAIRGRDKGRHWFFPPRRVMAERLAGTDLVVARTYSVPLLIAIRLAIRGTSTRFLVYEQHDPRPLQRWWYHRRDRVRQSAALYGTLRLRLLGRLLADGAISPVTQTPIVQALDDPAVVPFAIVRRPEAPTVRAEPPASGPVARPVMVLMVARFEPRKRHDLALEALAMLRAEGRKIRLTIVGQAYGPREESFRARVLAAVASSPVADDVTVETNLSPTSIAEQYANHDVLVLPAEREPASVAVVEAAAQGIPVIVTRTCGTACYVLDGVTGVHVDEGSSWQLAAALRHLTDTQDLHRSMAVAAAQHVAPLVDPVAVARRLFAEGP